MSDLKTDYKDDVLDLDANLNRRFKATLVAGETDVYEFEDVTEYSQTGDQFGASDINETNEKVNDISSNLTKLVATLTSGQTTVTWTDDRLSGTNVFLEFYADIAHKDLMPSEISVSGNVLTATYDEQNENVTVGVAISNQ